MTEGVGVYFEDHRESKDLGRRALRGGFVSVAMQYGNGALQIVAAVILARLLVPEDFGLVAIVTVLTSFAPLLIDFGLGDATVQRSKITRGQVNSLFWLSSGIGLAVAVVVAACSPLIAWLYGEPRLEPIALCTAITFLLGGSVKSALGAFTTFDAVWQGCQHPASQHSGRNCHCRRRRNLRIWLLGAGAASDCDVRCCWSVGRMPMEAWISCL